MVPNTRWKKSGVVSPSRASAFDRSKQKRCASCGILRDPANYGCCWIPSSPFASLSNEDDVKCGVTNVIFCSAPQFITLMMGQAALPSLLLRTPAFQYTCLHVTDLDQQAALEQTPALSESNAAAEPESGQSLLSTRICDLGLTIEGSTLEKFVQQLYRELEQKKIFKFRPGCYLTDEWGCPSGEPVIGIPFYLARADVAQVEKENNDLESAREIMMYLRHEAGHAFNYAYKLHRTSEWKQLFGPYRRPYRENYRPVLFSKDYVRYLPGWYAQKHPDEDFAETFAVWMTPRSNWRKKYRG